MEEKNNQQLSLELKQDIAGGSYSNLAVISHSHSEFIIDFATMLPGQPKALVNNRIIMTPEHVKRLMGALMENVGRYEAQFGRIELPGQPGATFNLGDFNPGGAKS